MFGLYLLIAPWVIFAAASTTITVTPTPFTGTLRKFMPKTTAITIQPTPTAIPVPASHCNLGELHCCKSVELASADQSVSFMKTFGVVLWGAEASVGLGCKTMSDSKNCTELAACCQHNPFAGVLTLGCVPADIDG